MNKLLNPKLCDMLREVVNETDIFIKDEEENQKFDMICAVMDRLDSAVKYINGHNSKPKNEDDFVLFMTHCCTLKDGINYIHKALKISIKDDSEIFEKILRRVPINLPENKKFSDDKFFEYFRSLVFAHPFNTSRAIPNSITSEEVQYSPFVLIDLHGLRKEKDSIGVMVYSNKRKSFSLTFSFQILTKYISNKYQKLNDVIAELKNIIRIKEDKWKERKVNRNLLPEEILTDIKDILNERCRESYIIDELLEYLNCEISNKENTEIVKKFRNKILTTFPFLCDEVDKFDHENAFDLISRLTEVRPNGYNQSHYQLEKIHCYLNDYDSHENKMWGLKQAEIFSKGFAKKWVKIDPNTMSFSEIRMLTKIACYMEVKEQSKLEELAYE